METVVETDERKMEIGRARWRQVEEAVKREDEKERYSKMVETGGREVEAGEVRWSQAKWS